MAKSKGRKIVLIAAAAVLIAAIIAAAIYFFGSGGAGDEAGSVADSLLNEGGGYLQSDPYDAATAADFIEDCWNPVKDSSGFREVLVNRLENEILEPALQSIESESSQQTENRYGDVPSPAGANQVLCRLMPFLSSAGYEDAALRESILDYYTGLISLELTSFENGEESDGAESGAQIPGGLMNAFSYVDGFNQFAGDFYKIQESELISEDDMDEIAGFYDRIIRQAYDSGDRRAFAAAVSQASGSDFLSDRLGVEGREILDFLTAGGEFYTLRPGIGGYYDDISQNPELDYDGNFYGGGNATFSGDFYYEVYESAGGQYDMSEITPEIWALLTPSQRAEIQEGNTVTTQLVLYLQGEEVESAYRELVPELAESGFNFAWTGSDGGAVFLSEDALRYFPDAESIGSYLISGDFSQLVDDAMGEYGAQGDEMQTAVSAIALGDYQAATQAFMSLSDNGTDLESICRFASELQRNGVLEAGLEIIYGNINLPEEDIIQLEVYISTLF